MTNDGPHPVKLELVCESCGYRTLAWGDARDQRCPQCPPVPSMKGVADLPGVGAKLAGKLSQAGYGTIDELDRASVEELDEQAPGIGRALAARIKSHIDQHDGSLTEPSEAGEIVAELTDEEANRRSPYLGVQRVWMSDGEIAEKGDYTEAQWDLKVADDVTTL